MNTVLDEGLPLHPLQEQRDSVRDWRQIGLGIMGLADMLIKMGITYGSEESIGLCDDIGYFLAKTAIIESRMLGEKYGSYPKFNADAINLSAFHNFHSSIETTTLRNSQLLTIAPTGTLSTMLGISGGIEPIFANSYKRKTESLHGEDKYYTIFTPIVWEYLQHNNLDEDAELPEYFVTSQDIDFHNRIDMQSVWQQHIDASISSTVNLPNSATVDDVKELYMYAWKQGLKGITVFRDGCKRMGVLTTDTQTEEENPDIPILPQGFNRGDIMSVSDDLIGYKRKIINGCGDFQEQLFFDEVTGEPLENYIAMGDGGGCSKNLEAISRLISLCFRAGVDPSVVIEQLKKVRPCVAYKNRAITKGDTSKGTSCPNAIGCAIEELNEKIQERCFADFDLEDDVNDTLILVNDPVSIELKNRTTDELIDTIKFSSPPDSLSYDTPMCPDCGEPLYMEGGCNVCKACGYSKCD